MSLDIATYQSYLNTIRATTAITALASYEYLITLKYEVDFLRRRKWTAATWIFLANRYLMLASVIFQMAPGDPKTCADQGLEQFLWFFTIAVIPAIPTSAFTVIRIFALLQQESYRHLVAWALIIQSVFVMTANSYVVYTQVWVYVDDPILGPVCAIAGSNVSIDTLINLTIAMDAVAIFSAAAVLSITVWKTLSQVRSAASLGMNMNLSQTLLRDGSVMFFITLILNVMSAVESFNGVGFPGLFGSIWNAIQSIAPPIMLSRFLINLRQVDSPHNASFSNGDPSRFSVPNFRMPTMDNVIGNLGESLEFVEYTVDDEDTVVGGTRCDMEGEKNGTDDGSRHADVASLNEPYHIPDSSESV